MEFSRPAARTFPSANATIGLAYKCRRIIRSRRDVDPEVLRKAMEKLELNKGSRAMSQNVKLLLAILILQPETDYLLPDPTAGVIYVDSKAGKFFVDDEELRTLVSMADQLISGLERSTSSAFADLQYSLDGKRAAQAGSRACRKTQPTLSRLSKMSIHLERPKHFNLTTTIRICRRSSEKQASADERACDPSERRQDDRG